MKKLLLSVFMLAGLSTASYAQGIIGPKVGLAFSNAKDTKATDSTSNDYSSLVTPQLGVVFNARLGDYVSLRPEILFSQRGFKINGNGYTAKARFNYIEVPFNVVGTIKAGPGKIEVFAGPSVGYLFGGKAKVESAFGSNDYTIKGEDKPSNYNSLTSSDLYFNYLNVSMNMGLGYNWKGLIFQAEYNLGFSNINPHFEDRDSPQEDHRSDYVTKFSSVNLAIIYLFGGKDE